MVPNRATHHVFLSLPERVLLSCFCLWVLCLFTAFISTFFMFPRKNLLLLNLIRIHVISATVLVASVNETIVHFVQHFPLLVSCNIEILRIQKNRETPACIAVLCILQIRLIWCYNVGHSESICSNFIMLYTNRTGFLYR